MDYTTEQLDTLFNALPSVVQDIIVSDDTREAIIILSLETQLSEKRNLENVYSPFSWQIYNRWF